MNSEELLREDNFYQDYTINELEERIEKLKYLLHLNMEVLGKRQMQNHRITIVPPHKFLEFARQLKSEIEVKLPMPEVFPLKKKRCKRYCNYEIISMVKQTLKNHNNLKIAEIAKLINVDISVLNNHLYRARHFFVVNEKKQWSLPLD